MRMLSEREFSAFVTSRPVVVIHIDASWDGYGDQVREKMHVAEKSLKEFAAFAEVDCDREAALCKVLGVASIPFVAYFREGKIAVRIVGANQDVLGRTQDMVNGR